MEAKKFYPCPWKMFSQKTWNQQVRSAKMQPVCCKTKELDLAVIFAVNIKNWNHVNVCRSLVNRICGTTERCPFSCQRKQASSKHCRDVGIKVEPHHKMSNCHFHFLIIQRRVIPKNVVGYVLLKYNVWAAMWNKCFGVNHSIFASFSLVYMILQC